MVVRVRVSEIFYSLQGEAKTVGQPTTFIRLTGCPLRCHYCDTAYAFQGGELQTLDDIVDKVKTYPTKLVTVTGGEPLAQPDCLPLLRLLIQEGYRVSLETSGALPIASVPDAVSIVLDLKTPGSGEVHRNLYENIAELRSKDQIKFVILDKADYDWARFKISEFDLNARVEEVLFSPVYESLTPVRLAEWILEDGLEVRLQVQLHKLLWGDKPGV
ncbi:MAG: 7-carboxy-7-deazaguanine synthase QueE [Gammaproteobacteria bacterium TMED95]|nr:7-carboxy-7-deazaguanine synthase QueE [Gammaproteobacteria bacterium]OUV19748.1 MAG: 7-carboxy-7-deazaguanine synthase QueE [Gammaproteobacteria bacterium TMED95]